MDEYFINELDHYPYAYDAGHFHRVYVGEVFHNRYRVYRKLGFGSSCTVWLVKDIASGHWRAMKVLSAKVSNNEDELCELEILQHLHQGDLSHPGRDHTQQLIDSFLHPGSEGLHRCFIFPVMGESLATYVRKFDGYRIPPRALKKFAAQLLLALDYAHMHGVIHTDVKPDNIMIKMKDESVIDDWYMETTEGCTEPEGLEQDPDQELTFLFRPDSDRLHPSKVPCIPFANYYMGKNPTVDDYFNVDLVLADWGVATWIDPTARTTDEVVPFALRSPELLVQAPWDEKVDIWALGLVLVELAENVRLFTGEGPLGDDEEVGYHPVYHLCKIVETFGDIPLSLLEAGNPDMVDNAFDADGKLIAKRNNTSPPFQDWIQNMQGLGKEQFMDLTMSMLTLEPSLRPNTETLLDSPWLDLSFLPPEMQAPDQFEDHIGGESDATFDDSMHGIITSADEQAREKVVSSNVEEDLQTSKGTYEAMEWTEQHVIVSSDGTGYVTGADISDVPDGHEHKKVKLSTAGVAVPHDHEFLDNPMGGSDEVSTPEAIGPGLLTCGPSEKQPDPASGMDKDSTSDKRQKTDEEAAEEEPFLGNENGQKMIRHPLNRGVAFFGTATPVELILGGFWLFKELVAKFFGLLG